MGQLSRRISPFTLFMLSMNAIIGSGWLFAPLYAAKIAGPAAIISWIIGGLAATLIAFTFAELSTMLPVAGGTAHIPQISHGSFASFVMSWIAWISSLMMTPIEVQAVLQYAALTFPSLMHIVNGAPALTSIGYMAAASLMIMLCLLNIFSYRGLMRLNFFLFVFKFSIIFITIITFLSIKFHPANFASLTQSLQTGTGWHAILSAVATGGIVMAFNGFKSSVELAGEAKKLSLAIPLSTAGAVFGCLLLYLGLQVCFIGALEPAAYQSGWQHLSFPGDLGPFVGLASALGLVLLLKLLYANSIVSPLGAGLIYVTSTARILYAMGKIGYVPAAFTRLNKQHLPIVAIIVNFAFGMLSFLPLPGWQAMVDFLISTMVIGYAMGPIALMCFRLTLPEHDRPFRLPAARTICLLAFYCCNLFSYWTGWETMSKLGYVLLVGLILFYIAYLRGAIKMEKHEFKPALWIIPYLGGLVLISYLGAFGGRNIIPFGWDFLVIAIFSVVSLYFAVKYRAEMSSAEVADYLFAEAVTTK